MNRLRFLFVAVACLFGSLGQASAALITVVDQSLLPDATLGGGPFILNQQLGQGFTPTLSSVDAVEFWIYDHAATNGKTGTLEVRLYAGTFGGTLLGISNSVVLPDGYGNTGNIFTSGALTQFVFPTIIALIPGQLYLFEIRQQNVVGTETQLVLTSTGNSYSGGAAYHNGNPNHGQDFFFREGLLDDAEAVPEPSSLALLGIGGVGMIVGAARRRRQRCAQS